MEITLTGMVISSMPIGEYDRRVEILTAQAGRISAFARGARRAYSPLVACTRPFASGKFTLFQGSTSYTLSSAEISEFFEELASDFELGCYGSYFLETAKYFSRENLPADAMLKLLYMSLKALSVESLDLRLVKSIYEIKLLDINGILKMPSADEMSEPCAYAFEYVRRNPIGKIYSFKLKKEVLDEFEKKADELFKLATDVEFISLKMLEDMG